MGKCGPKLKNRIEIRYGRLVAKEYAGRDKQDKSLWLCKCDCGKEIIVRGYALQRGSTKSCGCLRREMLMGKNNPNYIDGHSCRIVKEEKRKQNNYKCQEYGKTQKEEKQKLAVHHIDGDDTNNNEENLITLCKSCHRKTIKCR